MFFLYHLPWRSLHCVPTHRCPTFCLHALWLMGTAVSSLRLWCSRLLWTFAHSSSSTHIFAFLLGECLGGEGLDSMLMTKVLRNCQTAFWHPAPAFSFSVSLNVINSTGIYWNQQKQLTWILPFHSTFQTGTAWDRFLGSLCPAYFLWDPHRYPSSSYVPGCFCYFSFLSTVWDSLDFGVLVFVLFCFSFLSLFPGPTIESHMQNISSPTDCGHNVTSRLQQLSYLSSDGLHPKMWVKINHSFLGGRTRDR